MAIWEGHQKVKEQSVVSSSLAVPRARGMTERPYDYSRYNHFIGQSTALFHINWKKREKNETVQIKWEATNGVEISE